MTDHKQVDTPRTASAATSDGESYVRLHVSPFDADLLKVALSSAQLSKARNISYHALETFPEKRYGFVELPPEDAEKLKKKLNGSVLRGAKFRIEQARPPRFPSPVAEAAMAKDKQHHSLAHGAISPSLNIKDKTRKKKRKAEELTGVVLGDDRKIKRGWTHVDEPKEKKRSKKDKDSKKKAHKGQSKSKYTDHEECLIKTVLPTNATPLTDLEDTSSKKKKKGKSREVVVHEFERTVKFPTFIKTADPARDAHAPVEFVEGKGWVKEDGDVVETVKVRPPRSGKVLLRGKAKARIQDTESTDEEDKASSSDEASNNDADEVENDVSTAGSESTSNGSILDVGSSPSSPTKSDAPRPQSSASAKSLSIKIPPATPNEPKVHPLEALYKRTGQAASETSQIAQTSQGFNFFGGSVDESEEETGNRGGGETLGPQAPLTPFTRHDLELRGVRSTAPTPDTAHPSRRYWPWDGDNGIGAQAGGEGQVNGEESEEDLDDHGELDDTALGVDEGKVKPASDFQKWFWENRGDLNRAWKKRRKVAGKEKRYRENKARMARAI
ncbi:hypothetical protein B0J18DRAFT_257855 [Chaetomium sp. MPI-SDFR-AT-0129]|nr:hypothetical protein B0J18DRAFT_257855 [Chaetomium sp. MPI-SDFR-AT-0129]